MSGPFSARAASRSTAYCGALAAFVIRALGKRIHVIGFETVARHMDRLEAERGAQSLIFFHWAEDEIPRLIVAQQMKAGLGVDVRYVTDDTVGGRLGASVLERLGYSTLLFRTSHSALRISDMRRIITQSGALSISADGRGPYGVVHPGLPQLVKVRKAVAVPVSVVASRAVRIRRPGPMAFPVPGAKIAVAIGTPISSQNCDTAYDVERFELGLREARSRCQLILSTSRS